MSAAPSGMVARAFSVLGAFDDRHESVTLTELARRSGLPINTTLRIARSLQAEGALDRADDGRFSIGMRLYELAALTSRGVGLRHAALPFLQDLHAETGHHALLAIREGDEAILLERLSPRTGASRVEYRIGGRMPLAATGGGLILLAFGPDDVRERALSTFDPRRAVDGVTSAGDLRRLLSITRRTGRVVGTRTRPEPRSTAAVPIFDGHGTAIAALSVVLSDGEEHAAHLLALLEACSTRISAALR